MALACCFIGALIDVLASVQLLLHASCDFSHNSLFWFLTARCRLAASAARPAWLPLEVRGLSFANLYHCCRQLWCRGSSRRTRGCALLLAARHAWIRNAAHLAVAGADSPNALRLLHAAGGADNLALRHFAWVRLRALPPMLLHHQALCRRHGMVVANSAVALSESGRFAVGTDLSVQFRSLTCSPAAASCRAG